MTDTLTSRIVGDDARFTFTGRDSTGAAEDITGHAITCMLADDQGNSLTLTVGSGITLLTQSGATLGQATIAITPSDFPAAWLALGFGTTRRLNVEVQRVGGGFTSTLQTRWVLKGQMIS